MTDDPKLTLDKTLSLIDRIVIELPKVRRRGEFAKYSREFGLDPAVRGLDSLVENFRVALETK